MSSSNQFDDDRTLPLRRLGYLLQAAGGLIALTILGVGWLVADAMADQAETLAQATAQAVALSHRGAQVRDQHSELTDKVKSAQQQVQDAQNRLGVGPQESRFIAKLTDLAEHCGLDVSDVRPGGTTPQGSYGVLELQFSAEGNYDSLCSLLSAMNELPRICHLGGMNVTVVDAAAGKLRIELKLQLLFSTINPEPNSGTETRA